MNFSRLCFLMGGFALCGALCGAFLFGAGLLSPSRSGGAREPVGRFHWVTGYWRNPVNGQSLPAAQIGYSALTHIVHYALTPNSDGSFEAHSLEAVQTYASELVSTAHSHGVRVLLGVAQTSYGGDFTGAVRASVLPTFLANLLRLVNRYGYDGVDLDWEPHIEPRPFLALVKALRKELDAQTRPLELTGAFWEAPWYLVDVQDAFDQINIMAYDNCSPADGFSWHNAALYNKGYPRRRTVDWRVNQFLRVIPAGRLGLGIPFYGYAWTGGSGTPTGGVSGPGQRWSSRPAMHGLDFREIVHDPHFGCSRYERRDQAAGGVPFLSIDRLGSAHDMFVTYDDEISVRRKVSYARTHALGGLMIYELAGDYLPERAEPHPLLDAVAAVTGPLRDPVPRFLTAASR